ncbi:hypothetical protein OH77DRAFT_828989 [Trametes cingulata]|nr:hypothetical protein OH77DRAFT_828989 [Trametes cingulata]
MPKRAPTPPPADDTRFFTVVNPYPEQPYLTPEDSKIFARWIACIIGQEHLLAFYHKPKSPNVVIIETSKFGPDFSGLMGEHRWEEILKKPSGSEMREASRIFPSTLTTTRVMEKTGWICRDIPMFWFKKWSPSNDSSIAHPYPQPRHCEPPSEDITRYPLCRPIPRNNAEKQTETSRRPLFAPASPIGGSSRASSEAPSTPSTSDSSEFPWTPPPECTSPTRRFVPAIHGCDIPRASDIIIISPPGRPLSSNPNSADDEDDDDEKESAQVAKNLCSVHGALCVSGICKECAARKREARFAERTRQREAEPGRRGSGRTQGRRDGPGRGPYMPAHLHNNAKSGSDKGADPRSRLRDDIRVEMASRKRAAKSVTSTATRAMPAHLLKGSSASQAPKTSSPSASVASISLASSSQSSRSSLSSDDSISETESTPPSSVLDASEDTCSVSSGLSEESKSSSLPEPEPQLPQVSQPGPWGPCVNWQAYAKVPQGDARSVATGATDDAFGNPWKHVPSLRPAPFKWADDVEEAFSSSSVGVRAAWDDADSSEDDEPF